MADLKNVIINDTGQLKMPVGTTAQRPASPVDGDIRFNTDLGYVEYYFKGFWVNSQTLYGGITYEGCICLLDADNPNSWPGSGSTITDLTGNGYNGTLNGTINSATTDTGSTYLYGAPGSYIYIPLNVSSTTGNDFTVISAAGYNGGNRNRITTTASNNWLLGHWGDGDVRYYAEGWVSQESSSGGGSANNQWGVHTGTGHGTTDEWQYFKNGAIKVPSGITGGSNGPTSLQIGAWLSGGTNEQSDWKWQFIAVYDRVLGVEEIIHTTQALRIRGGY